MTTKNVMTRGKDETMVLCQDCGLEMRSAASCTAGTLIIGDERVARERIGTPIGPADRCGDCGAKTGGFHHLGCDLERCPLCRWQLISCGCGSIDDDTRRIIPVIDAEPNHPTDEDAGRRAG